MSTDDLATQQHICGLIGGLSWASSIDYYRLLNEGITEQLGGLQSAHCIMYSLDLAPYAAAAHTGDYTAIKKMVSEAAANLKKAGATFCVICSNTAHMAAPWIDNRMKNTDSKEEKPLILPLLHIADCCAQKIKELNFTNVGLIGTEFTMKESYLKDRLTSHGLKVLVPESPREWSDMQRVIEEELSHKIVMGDSRKIFVDAIENMALRGADCVILGCTEIPLLVKQEHVSIPVIDSMKTHVQAAVAVQIGKINLGDFL